MFIKFFLSFISLFALIFFSVRVRKLEDENQCLHEENADLTRQLHRALRPSGTATPREGA